MKYWYFSRHAFHWISIAKMIEEIYSNDSHPDDVMVLGVHNYFSIRDMKEKMLNFFGKINKIIVYQLEPLIEGHFHSIEKILKNIEEADEIWEYDLQNMDVLKKYNIEAKYKPFHRCNSFKTVPYIENPDIDLLFYGTFSIHRATMISQLVFPTEIKPAFMWLHDIYDNRLYEFMSRSKIILNLNQQDSYTRQQQPRIAHALSNNKCILSEKNLVNYFGEDIVEFEGCEDGVKKLDFLLTNNNWKNYPKNRF